MTWRLTPDKKNRRYILLGVILLIIMYAILPQLAGFRASWHLLSHPNWLLAVAGFMFTFLTYLAGAATYCMLAFKPLPYLQVVLIQLAAMLINRVFPAGLGAAGANYAYLRHRRHKASEAAGVVAINNLIGFFGHSLIVMTVLALYGGSSVLIGTGNHTAFRSLILISTIGAVCIIGLIAALRRPLRRFIKDTTARLFSYRHKQGRLALGLFFSLSLTICNILSFALCAQAVGLHLSFAAFVIVFTFGVGAGTATPSPGGLGGFEAGLVVGMLAYHVASPLALSAALLYRLVSYWLPLLAGVPSLIVCQKRQLFRTS